MSTDEALARTEKLLESLEEARQQLEQTEDSQEAIELLAQLAELAKEIETELARVKRQAEADANS